MRKKITLRLFLLTVFMALLWSCRSEDLLQEESLSGTSANLSSAKYASRSLWKEDQVYINKVQQVFLKIANLEHVRTKYGELNWDYAMSFGNFNETYALIPIIKDNKVVLLMEAVRTGNRVFFYEKDNKDLIEFFNLALYSNVIKYDEEINAKANAVSKISAFVCTTRWLTIGCFDNEPNCVPYTKAVTNCEFQGGGIPPKTFDPIGMDGGGGGNNGYEYPEIPEEEDPCAKTKNLLENQDVENIVNDLKNHLSSGEGGEKGWRLNKSGPPTETTQNSGHSVNFGDPSTMNGGYHNHTGTGVNMFSATDIATLIEIVRYQSIGEVGNGYMGIIAPNGIHYVIYFNGTHEDIPAYPFTPKDKEDWNTLQAYWVDTLPAFQANLYSSDSGNTISSRGLEKLFFNTLDKMGLSNKITLQKVENNSVSTINLESNGVPQSNPCQ